MFRPTQTINRQPQRKFQNKPKYSAIVFKIRDPICFTIVITYNNVKNYYIKL
jgi:hypothetical protein